MPLRPLRLFFVIVACLSPLRLRAIPPPRPSQKTISVSLSASRWTVVPLPFQAIWVGSHNGNLWACGWNEGIAKSSDGGKTWQVVHFRKNGEICLSLSFDGRQVVAPLTGGGLLGSRDGGKTWDRRPRLAIAPKSITLCGEAAIALTPKIVAYAPNLRHAQWSFLSVKLPPPPSGTPDVLSNVQVACQDATHWGLMVAGDRKSTPPRFYTTANGGKSWSVLAFASSLEFQSLVARRGIYDLMGEKHVGFSEREGLLLYSSNGTKWGTLPEPLPGPLRSCSTFFCRTGNGWEDFRTNPARVWHLPKGHPEPATSWAFSGDVACATGARMACTLATTVNRARLGLSYKFKEPQQKRVKQGRCLKCSIPGYPETAEMDGCQGTVIYHGIITLRGKLSDLVLVYAPCTTLAVSARANLKRWRYAPTLLDGKPIIVETSIGVIYKNP